MSVCLVHRRQLEREECVCVLEIVYAVKDCDPCDRAILSSQSGRLWLLPTVSVCLSVRLSVNLSRFYGLYFGCYGLDFDQTWWECWNLGPIDCIKISLRYAARSKG